MPYVGVGVIVLFVLVVVAYVVWRFRQGGQMEGGGSMGHQMFGRDKDDWGPKP
jgi:heme/copper-type cytochrome/quinol oxidase subunit 2